MRPRLVVPFPAILAFALLAVQATSARAVSDADSLYLAVHPRLAFTRDEIPSFRQKLNDGGADDGAYAGIRDDVLGQYPFSSLAGLMNIAFGMNFLFEIGLVAHLDQPGDQATGELGRRLTVAFADSLAPDDDQFFAPIRLRSLCYGYDLCMDRATPEERSRVRAEIESYIDSLTYSFNFERWLHPPYTSNITAMIGSSLGIAAICLADETDPLKVAAALKRADAFVATWLRYHLDPGGSCFEGVQYGAWAMRHLAWYFEARRRYDGVDYGARDDVRRIEQWLAYEVLPERGGPVNNLNDTGYLNYPLARHNTYIEWALSRWNSGLASWLWDRVLGPGEGYDWGNLVDRPATALWHRSVPPQPPGDVLPRALLWKERGLYYFRTGWPAGADSDDLVFSFYCGIFHGGHSQEDEGNFTLYGFGSRFAADNGFEQPNWASKAHNLVFIDGKGQHFSGTSVGTDGNIAAHLITPYADYLRGDATAAYGTHSPYNQPGVPFPDDDWSYGYLGANPVQHAWREWLVVHGNDTPPYFVLVDDVQKDDVSRSYAWRMHTDAALDVNLSTPSLRIDGPRGALEIDVCYPSPGAIERSLVPFENTSVDPNTNIITLATQAARGFFALTLRPVASGGPVPTVTTTHEPWGGTEVIAWPGDITDVMLVNAGTDTVEAVVPLAGGASLPLRTDARILHLRRTPDGRDRVAMVRATIGYVAGSAWLRSRNGPVTAMVAGATAYLDRADAMVRLRAPGVSSVQANERSVAFTRSGAYVTIPPSPIPTAAAALRVQPQPSRGTATIVIESDATRTVSIDVFDVAGRRVRTLQALSAPGSAEIAFDGLDDLARPLASGVYFLRARDGSRTLTARFVLVR
ncbi:MAG TPA: T9SS type A sorting domain-containing protein [Candidatus Krumholzibacteria bacterium]